MRTNVKREKGIETKRNLKVKIDRRLVGEKTTTCLCLEASIFRKDYVKAENLKRLRKRLSESKTK